MFFVLAKVLWFLLQPSSLVLGSVLAGGALSATRWCRLGRRLLWGAGAALVLLGLSSLSDLLILPLETRFPRAQLAALSSDDSRPLTGIIVLGGGEDGQAAKSPELAPLSEAGERYTEAAALARRFPGARVVLSGGSGALLAEIRPEAEMGARLLEALGVARERITLETKSRDTYENAVLTARLVRPGPDERWLLVTSAWHMPRAMGCFRRAGFAVEPWPVDYRTPGRFDPFRLHGSIPEGLRRLDTVTREYVGLVAYYLAGRTDALLP